MNLIKYIRNFWLDFFAANYQRLIKNAKYETPLSIVMHTSFTQAVNFNTVLVILLVYVFKIKLNFIILFAPIVILCLINSFFFYKKLNLKQRNELLLRRSKYKMLIYDLYDVFSTVILIIVVFMTSKYTL